MTTAKQRVASASRRAENRERARKRGHRRVRARPILAGARVKITRRCLERRMFLATGRNPDEIRQFYGYTLGLALQRYGVACHAANQMGDHHHIDGTDCRGNLPQFKTSLHANLARGLNAKRGRFDKFWGGGGSCDTYLPSDEETLNDLVYTEVNPVKAGLVKWASRWPGFTTYGWRFGETRKFKRPTWYFDPDNPDNPAEVEITRVRPNIYPDLSDDELFGLLMARVRESELAAQEHLRAEGRRFMGEEKLAKQDWNRRASSWEDRFKITPKVAASCRWKRLMQLQRDRCWERAYAEAIEDQLAGKRPVFPHGTYWMRRHAGVRVATAPP